jgi:hypothetical protein
MLFFWFTTLTYSQEKNGPMNMENLPAVVKKYWDDFSVYPPDRNADPKVRLQDSFIAYDLGVNYEGRTYLVYMEIKGGPVCYL